MKDSMRKRMSFYEEEKVTEKYKKQQTAKCEKSESSKTQKLKVTKRTNVGASTEGEVEAAEGNTEARRKDDNCCTEVRNGEEVPALMEDEKC